MKKKLKSKAGDFKASKILAVDDDANKGPTFETEYHYFLHNLRNLETNIIIDDDDEYDNLY